MNFKKPLLCLCSLLVLNACSTSASNHSAESRVADAVDIDSTPAYKAKDTEDTDFTDISGPYTPSSADYRLYALLGKCAELVYYSPSSALTDQDSLRRAELLDSLNNYGIIAIGPHLSSTMARDITSAIDQARQSTEGFKAAAFYNPDSHTCILAFAGTEPQAADIIADIQGSFSINEPQNKTVISTVKEIATIIRRTDPEAKIILTGHSLGGRLASIPAIIFGLDAVVFNPANIPIDLHKHILSSPRLAENAETHLRRIHSSADELTAAMNVGRSLRSFVPQISRLIDSGSQWLDDTTSFTTAKNVISALPEIAEAADAIIDIFSPRDKTRSSADSNTRIALALIKNMRRYGINADDLQNPLFYRYAGRRISPTPAHGPHAIAPLNAALDSAASAHSELPE